MSKLNKTFCCGKKTAFTTTIEFDENLSSPSSPSYGQNPQTNEENVARSSSNNKRSNEETAVTKQAIQISKSTIDLMKDISVTEIPGIRGPLARNLFRRGYVHMYFLARDFVCKFDADEVRFEEWFKRNFTTQFTTNGKRADVIANRVVRFIIQILFDDTDDYSKTCADNSKRTSRCVHYNNDVELNKEIRT
jgi:hypothetical protein